MPRHFHKTEMADAAHLDSGAVIFEGVLQPAFHRTIVTVLLHVDEVDNHQTGKIAQSQLPGNFITGFKVGFHRRIFDIVFARGFAGIDINRNQGFRLVHDDIAAGRQRNRWRV